MASISTNTKRVSDLPATTSTSDTNLAILYDGSNLRNITFSNLKKEIVEKSASAHNCIFRGKNLGTTITDAQWAAISAGTFDDLFIGDYWTINGTAYMIADFDYFYNTGEGSGEGQAGIVNKHHIVMIPKTYLYTAKMNEENITTGGYVGSQMYTTNLETATTKIEAAFGDHLLPHVSYLVNAVSDGWPSGRVWVSREVDLMTESMVYGHYAYSPCSNGATAPSNAEVENRQLACYRIAWQYTHQRSPIWLQNVASATTFAYLLGYGPSHYNNASTVYGVRPFFLIS